MEAKKVLRIVIPVAVVGTVIYIISLIEKKKKADQSVKHSPLTEPPPASATPATNSSDFPLKLGSRNSTVTQLQVLLGVTSDGIFGNGTQSALKAFSGKTTVDTQAEFDALKSKKATMQSQSASSARAQTLYNQFKAGGLNIYTQETLIAYGFVKDYAGAISYTGKSLTMPKAKTYNNKDYVLTGYTIGGNLMMQITAGDLKGDYIINPNYITLVK